MFDLFDFSEQLFLVEAIKKRKTIVPIKWADCEQAENLL